MENLGVFETLREAIVETLPELEPADIRADDTLRDLGANSVDRMNIISETLEAQDLKVSMVEFGELRTLQEIVDLIEKKRAAAAQ
ncbi:acyl carrier protein [Actinobacteria bacterium YIM 96077]|uniref:Acyl carrier protein n=1 Tax=Phytoactinopolyspora halophila TaxID=1981511 RepID=A0A329QIJ3_9ACTN|nr:phosphopantetheine-binding protein [Phytoactinopolyspora halophila]AYY14159.1 acyl carrier protein [Actinobacteria bacterium YIM 96077]RAW10248.1 acyl carrier protein [Phytoactinopolyspora halophila]